MAQSISLDLQRLIFSFLGGAEDSRIPKDYLLACSSVCKRWQEASEDKLWERVRKQKLYTFTPVPGCGSLKKQCLERLKGIAERLVEDRYETRAFRVQNPPDCAAHSSYDPVLHWKDKLLLKFKTGVALYPHRREGVDLLAHEAFFPLPKDINRSKFFVRGDKLVGILNDRRSEEVLIWDIPSQKLLHKFSTGITDFDSIRDNWFDSKGEELLRVRGDKLMLFDFLGGKREKQFDCSISTVCIASDNRLFVALDSDLSPFPLLEQLNLQTLQGERVMNIKGCTRIEKLLTFQDRLFAASRHSTLIEIDMTLSDANPACKIIPYSKEIDQIADVREPRSEILYISSWALFGPYALETRPYVFRVYNLETGSHEISYSRSSKNSRDFHFEHGEWSEVGNANIMHGSVVCSFYDFNPPLPVPLAAPPQERSFWSCLSDAFECFWNWLSSLFA